MVLRLDKKIILIFVILCMFLIPCSFASEISNNTLATDNYADEITADGDIIYVSNDGDNGDGSLSNPYNSISDAVEKYNSTINSNIYIKNGNYDITDEININKDITIIGESREGTVLNSNSESSIFKITTRSQVTLINLTLKNANGNPALYLDDGDIITLKNCQFENNTKGAVYHYSYFGSITVNIDNSIFTNNYNNNHGAAVYLNRGSLNVTNSIFENNSVAHGETEVNRGGAIFVGGGILKTVYIDNCIFINNSATSGSAISQTADGDLSVFNSKFINNTSPGNTYYKDTINSSVIEVKSSNKGINLFLKNNTFKDNVLYDNIQTDDKVVVTYLDKNINLVGNNVEKYFEDDFNYIVTLTDENNNPISGKEIIATLTNTYNNNVTVITNTTGSNGQAVFSLKTQKPGKYSVVARFEGDETYDEIYTQNTISIRTENQYNIIFEPSYVYITEGESYNATGYIYDEYFIPVDFIETKFSVDWITHENSHLVVEGGLYKVTDGNKIIFDINRCHLVTRDEPYILHFNVTDIGSGVLTVDLSKNLSNIDSSLDTLYVSKDGNDTTGDGSENNPLETVQTALIANAALGGGKTIFVKEGIYDISTFTIIGNVTLIGEKGKTILRQDTGRLGMFEIDGKNIVDFINITFIDGYATPIPESLLHITDESTVYIDGCEFYNNTAYYGGAIAVSRGGSVYIKNSYFHENNGFLNTNGAGVLYVERGYAYIENSVFENNTASDGGVIYLGFESEADIINSTFVNNSALITTHAEGGGGAIFTRSNDLNIYNCSFIENYADLYGGAIYIDYGDVSIIKSYFESNMVRYSAEAKGSAIESAYNQYCNLTLNYCVLVCEENYAGNYLVYIHEIDEENHTYNVNYNYWKTTGLRASYGVANQSIIKISTENELIYTGDIVEFTVEFVNSNDTKALMDFVHDYELLLIPSIGSVENPLITIKNNKATFVYNATTVGEESIKMGNILLDKTYRFDVLDGGNKTDLNPEIEITPGKTSQITVSIDKNIDTNITVRVNDVDYSVAVNDAKAVLKIDTVPGSYEVKAIYSGNEEYKGFVISKTFEVEKYASKILAENITTYYNGQLKVTLLSDESVPIADEEVTIKINNTSYTVKTDENGTATLNLNLEKVGVYNVLTEFNGNSYFNSSQATSTITVEFANITIETLNENAVITPLKGSLSYKVTDNEGNPIRNIEITVALDSNDYKIKTNDSGIAVLDLSDNGLDISDYVATATIKATNVFNSAETKSNVKVIKENATLSGNDISVYANTGKLNVVLLDSEGNPIAGENITIELDSNINTLTTDINGSASLNLNLTPGNYSAVIKLVENKIYTAKDITVAVNIKETVTYINASDITVYYSNGKFTAELTDVNRKPIENARLIFSINGNDILALSDENGIASININNVPVGIYEVGIRFEGNSIFEASNSKATLTVLSSIISNDTKRGYNSPYDFEAKLLDSQGNPLSNVTVNFTVNGEKYSADTDSEGIVKLTEKFAVGTYAITFTNPSTDEKVSNYAQIIKRITGNKNLVMSYYDGSGYKVRVVADNGEYAGAGEIVTMKINSKTYKVKTDKNGYANLKLSLKPKKYTITATYKGVTVKNTVNIKQVIKVTKTTKVKKTAKKLTLKATLKNHKNKAIKNKKVTFKFKGKKYTAKTNKNGIAKVTVKKNVIKNLKKGKKYTVKVTYVKSTVKCYVKVN